MEFSLSRFWLLTRKQWVENRKLYALGALALTGILSFLIIFIIVTEKNWGFRQASQRLIFFAGLISAGALFSSTLLKSYEEKHKSIQAFMIPASLLEKFLVTIMYLVIFFPLVYFVIVYSLILIALYIDKEVLGHFNSLFSLNQENLLGSLVLCLVIQSCFLLFSVVFRRYAFLKTTVVVCVLLASCFFLNDYMAKTMLGDAQPSALPTGDFDPAVIFPKDREPHWFSFSGASLYSSITMYGTGNISMWEIHLPKTQDAVFKLYIICIAPLIWLITFFRLREKQL